MSHSAPVYDLNCDGEDEQCGDSIHDFGPLYELRKEARKVGWTFSKGKDFCGDCSRQRRSNAATKANETRNAGG